MCLIVHRFDKTNLPNDVIDINRVRNADGFGIAWRDKDGSLHHAKYGPQAFNKFRKQLKRIDRQPDVEYTAHFRFATTGAPCRDLSHPFSYIDAEVGEVLVFHNGVIPIRADKGESDTSQFVKDVLARLPSQWWNKGHLTWLVESAIGSSRMLLMTKDETIYINEGAWMQKGGLMYSTDPGGSHSKYRYAGKVAPWSGKGNDSIKYIPTGKGLLTPVAQAIEKVGEGGYIDAPDDLDFDVQTWTDSNGHVIESLHDPVPAGVDAQVEGLCVECQSVGDVWIIGGDVVMDIAHDLDLDDADEEDYLDLEQKFDKEYIDKRVAMYSH